MSTRSTDSIEETIAQALELVEEGLSAVTRIAIEQIRRGLETSQNVEAAERDMRSALRQLVLAERDVRVKAVARTNHPEPRQLEQVAVERPG